jgi:hypothetical protein
LEKINSCPRRESKPGRPARRYTDWAIPTHHSQSYLCYYINIQGGQEVS